jgi:hypothetical protein
LQAFIPRAVDVAASHDHSLALRLSRIVAHVRANIRAVLMQIVQHPRGSQRLHIESQGQPPPDTALELIGQGTLFEELSADTLVNAMHMVSGSEQGGGYGSLKTASLDTLRAADDLAANNISNSTLPFFNS